VVTKSADSLEDMKEDLQSLRDDVNKLISAIGDDTSDIASDTVAEARRQLKKIAKTAKKRGAESLGDVEAQIEQNPFTSIATAFGVGLIVGRLMGK
jgi:ElaB/YqjD/DUF883 family membrane-anchored ribosome-binding protein